MRKLLLLTSLLVGTALLALQVGCKGGAPCDQSAIDSPEALMECVTDDRVFAHLEALQDIADKHGGNRASGMPGYDASVAYVVDTLEAAGYDVELHEFDYTFQSPQSLCQTAPSEATLRAGRIQGTGSGLIEGPVIPIDLALGAAPWPADPADSSSGCQAEDFSGLDLSGKADIVLLQEGGCLAANKVLHAQEAGAEAALLLVDEFIQFDLNMVVGRVDKMLDATPSNVSIPVIGVHRPEGMSLLQDGARAALEVTAPAIIKQLNVLAELPGGSERPVVMTGAHLDSVLTAPGISDNGSGSAVVLETAVQMAGLEPLNTVRFAWWAGEETGIHGSGAYVESLSQEELDEIALYLNFDMIASPNYAFWVYDCEASDTHFTLAGAEGSCAIQEVFESYYEQVDQPFAEIRGRNATDHSPFLRARIPTGGIFTGADTIKNSEEEQVWGGTSGEAHDPCYHKPCDTTANIDRKALDINSDAAAFAIFHYAMDQNLGPK